MSLNYLYTNLRISLMKMALVEILGGRKLGLQALSDDLTTALTEHACQDALLELLIREYQELTLGEFNIEASEAQIIEELKLLVKEIREALRKIHLRNCDEVRSLSLVSPDILIIEYEGEQDAAHRRRTGTRRFQIQKRSHQVLPSLRKPNRL